MIDRRCPICRRHLVYTLAETPNGAHWVCDNCELVYVVEFRHLVLCTKPHAHLIKPPAWCLAPPKFVAHVRPGRARPGAA